MTIDNLDSNLDDYRPGLKPPRFSLSALFGALSLLGVLFAAMSYLGAYATLLAVLFALTVAAHVAGNVLGTQLRANGNRSLPPNDDPRPKNPRVSENNFAPASQLHHRSALGRPIIVTTAVGCGVGAVLGGVGLMRLMEHPTLVSSVLGFIASGVLGGIWTFAASSFLQVASGALRQATRDTKR